MTSEPLLPLNPQLSHIQVDERVAFPDIAEGVDHPYAGKYGLVKAVGIDNTGNLAFDVQVFDPFDGIVPEDAPLVRVGIGELQ